LILSLPHNKHLDFKGIQKENLSIEYFREKNLILLQLMDSDFNDLFDDLILSLYHGIKSLREVDEYSNHFIQAFYRWGEFFEDKKSDLLSEDAIKGIIGELLVLKLLITAPEKPEINFLLKAWTGLYDKGNDFELESKNLEVKAKSSSGIDIKISSEFQLELTPGKGLELFVVSLLSVVVFALVVILLVPPDWIFVVVLFRVVAVFANNNLVLLLTWYSCCVPKLLAKLAEVIWILVEPPAERFSVEVA
jgi:hypothetical protein